MAGGANATKGRWPIWRADERVIGVAPSAVYECARRALYEWDRTVKIESHPESLRIVARTGWSALNNGEIVEVSISDGPEGGSLLRVSSALTIRTVLVDYGLNRRNVKKVIGLVTDAVATRQPG